MNEFGPFRRPPLTVEREALKNHLREQEQEPKVLCLDPGITDKRYDGDGSCTVTTVICKREKGHAGPHRCLDPKTGEARVWTSQDRRAPHVRLGDI